MRALILSCNTGEGHNSCAKAIREVYVANGYSCDIADALEMISHSFSRFISWGHVLLYRKMPWLFRWGYGVAEKCTKSQGEKTRRYRLFCLGADGLRDLIQQNGYDHVICTHPFASLMLTEAQRRYALPVKTAFVATDYTCSPTVQDAVVDYYFIPHKDLAADFISPNIPLEKMIVSGIPVRQMLYTQIDKKDAKQQLGLPPGDRHIVLMCGSMGCGPMEKLTKTLCGQLPKDTRLTVVCGTNEKLRKHLKQRLSQNNRVMVRGYVENMSLLLDSADLYITKPGGISTTEATVKRIPMVLVDAVSGCERYNGAFFVGKGCAVMEKDTEKLTVLCNAILSDGNRYCHMADSLAQLALPNAARSIYETMQR